MITPAIYEQLQAEQARAEQEAINLKRLNTVKEVLSTEEDYVMCLEVMVEGVSVGNAFPTPG